ncbi:Protein tyrosine serine phosphatase [Mycena venus]|uniref:Protein tyrosine serine phosphatase n=1 Tax=Mycena venus TaxID=2733690 RepID=A0A8H6YPK3_9AGAR|nr:Protein tyrosine serine phosphatase [Mycena venus]
MSSLSALSSPPFVVIEGVINVRTIGGYKADASYIVNPKLVFRSGEVNGITETGKEQLLALGIRRIFDMRTNYEINMYKTASGGIPDVDFIHVPVGKEEAWDPEKRLKHYEENELEAFVKDAEETLQTAAPALEAIFRPFSREARGAMPISLHRTGLVAALILMLLGVDDADITKDYALTTVGLEPARGKAHPPNAEHPSVSG